MFKRSIVFTILCLGIIACSKQKDDKKADMYEASEVSQMMREMVEFSKECKTALEKGEKAPEIPSQFWGLKEATATRGEHKEAAFQGMSEPYLNALKGIERGDSQQYYYRKSIDACKTCHSVYCGGPMSIINQL